MNVIGGEEACWNLRAVAEEKGFWEQTEPRVELNEPVSQDTPLLPREIRLHLHIVGVRHSGSLEEQGLVIEKVWDRILSLTSITLRFSSTYSLTMRGSSASSALRSSHRSPSGPA